MNDQWIVTVGNFIDGVTFYGPFKNHFEALSWAEEEVQGEPWNVAPLEDPEGE
jgi:hypothetical protein